MAGFDVRTSAYRMRPSLLLDEISKEQSRPIPVSGTCSDECLRSVRGLAWYNMMMQTIDKPLDVFTRVQEGSNSI
jgi:hypothetical protein